MSNYDPKQPITGLGCALVVPTALVGTMLLIDDHLPSLQTFTELFGLTTLCSLVGVVLSSLHGKFRRDAKASFLAAAIAGGVLFFVLTIGVASPATADWVKWAFTTSLQLLGPLGVLFLLVAIVSKVRRSYRS